jgi:exonuclease III
MVLKLAWWNTSLAPVAKQGRATPASIVTAIGVIVELLDKQKYDLVGLCELSAAEIAWLQLECDKLGYAIANGVGTKGRSKTDTCLIYRKSRFKLLNSVNQRGFIEGRHPKIAQRVELRLIPEDSIFNVLISHWPSVRTYNKGSGERDDYGYELRRLVDEILKSDQHASVVLMGDYNDEPFDRPLASKLRASRDRAKVVSARTLLYNPFWHRIGSDRDYTRAPNNITFLRIPLIDGVPSIK